MFNFLKTAFRKWTPWEEAAIESFLPMLAPKYRECVEAQLKAVNKVYRLLGGIEIETFVMRKGKVDRTGVPKLFDDREFVLAKLQTIKGKKRIETRVFCVSGYIFSFESTEKIHKLAYDRDLEVSVLEIDKRFGMKGKHNPALHSTETSSAE